MTDFNLDISQYEYPDLKPLEQDWRWCHKYAYDVLKGNVPAGKLIKQACMRHFRDMERDDLYFDETAANSIVRWFKFIPITDGKNAGSPTILLPWQIWLVVSLIAWKWKYNRYSDNGELLGSAGERRFNQCFVLVSRKAGKTTLAAGIVLYLLYKSGFQPRAYSVATKRDQAKLLWNTAKVMIKLSPRLQQYFEPRANDILLPGKEGEFKPLASDSNQMDGLNPVCVSLDELHAYKDRNLYGVMTSAFGAQTEYLLIGITTAGFVLDGLCTDLYRNGCRVLDPTDDVVQDNYFYAMWQIDKDDDWSDPNNWYKSNAGLAYGLPSMKYLHDRYAEATMSISERANFITKHLNIFVSGSDKWLDMEKVLSCGKPLGTSYLDPIYRGRKCYIGLDRARVNDITSFPILFPMDDGGLDLFFVNLLPRKTIEGATAFLNQKYLKAIETGDLIALETPTVRDDDIKYYIRKLNGELSPEGIYYDPWHMRSICEDMETENIPLISVSQGTGNMSEPAKILEGLVEEGLLRFDSVLFEYACECAMMRLSMENNMKVYRENDKIDKIDPLIATIIGLSGATLIKAERNVYEERGLLTI
jgi:phage terminase large subunit-like protein